METHTTLRFNVGDLIEWHSSQYLNTILTVGYIEKINEWRIFIRWAIRLAGENDGWYHTSSVLSNINKLGWRHHPCKR